MSFKKIYIEITNNCNLNCSFCIHNQRKNKYMTLEEFKIILSKLKGHTKYLYFHVLGEPLIHPYINEFINEASKNFYINITTNGYFIDKIKFNKNIRQINISLHSNVSNLDMYMDKIFDATDVLKKYTFINYRLWLGNDDKILKKLEEKYQASIKTNKTIEKNVFVDIDEEFVWPNLNNNIYKNKGKCYGLKSHVGILVDGTVVPCCLDGNGCINLGNIFDKSFEEIINSKKAIKIIEGFNNNVLTQELCKHCGFIDKINKN